MKKIFIVLSMLLFSLSLSAGWIEKGDAGQTIINLKLYNLPDSSRTDTPTLAKIAVLEYFKKDFPRVLKEKYAEKYKADPAKYGDYDWNNVEIRLHKFSGLALAGTSMDSGPLMAIAGGVSPDVLYVNFRQSDTYIQSGFLYPLDKEEDGYLAGMTEEEKDFAIPSRILPVIARKGPDGNNHKWMLPSGGLLGKVVAYRKDLLDANGIEYPTADWTWDDFFENCKKLTNPELGTYGVSFGTGPNESFYWVTFLWSAGGEIMKYNPVTDTWKAVYDGPEAAQALDFYTRLCTEHWVDDKGQNHWGYAIKVGDISQKWALGRIGYALTYMDEKLFSTIDPDLVGLVPVPLGPSGMRGAEINAGMQGIFAGIKDTVIRDTAWEYISFISSKKAGEITTKIMVEGGFGQFVNPKYLRMFGYSDIIRLAPKGWEETFDIAIKTGRPEPYGKNCQLVYLYLSKPIQEVESMALKGELPENQEERLAYFEKVLSKSVNEANKKMIGYIPPDEMRVRRITAVAMLICIVISFFFIFRKIIRAFTPPSVAGVKKKQNWGFKKYYIAYIILIPALLSIALWQYFPLLVGSKMAFQDYKIMGGSLWVGVDNFANILWDGDWWSTVWNSARYSILVITLTFLPPVILAVLLQEIPRCNIFFRTVFYLPAVISGLVVVFLWKSFYAPNQYGVLNAILMKIPAIGFIALGLLFFLILFFFAKRLLMHDLKKVAFLCFFVGLFILYSFIKFTVPIFTDDSAPFLMRFFSTIRDPYRWLQDPGTAMVCCVIPSVWAGMGPGCLIYLAALKGVAPDFYEAADLDGATFIDKILFIVVPMLKPLLIIQFIGIFIGAWKSSANILAMTGGGAETEVAGLHIFYKAYMFLQFGQATAMAWILGFMLIGFTVYQLRILSRLEFKANV